MPIARVIRYRNFRAHGIDWVNGARAEGGLVIRHTSGVVVGHQVSIGKNATLLQNVTLGQKSISTSDQGQENPTLGNGIVVGCGAAILGSIHLGDNCVVGANSVVTRNVSSGSRVVGSPARTIENRKK
ncbi:serine O-acetyltransferase [Cryobacterium melibiosiphilum]